MDEIFGLRALGIKRSPKCHNWCSSLAHGLRSPSTWTFSSTKRKLVWSICDAPLSLGQTTVDYLNELRQNLEIASSYATEHGKQEQQRYISRYMVTAKSGYDHNMYIAVVSDKCHKFHTIA